MHVLRWPFYKSVVASVAGKLFLTTHWTPHRVGFHCPRYSDVSQLLEKLPPYPLYTLGCLPAVSSHGPLPFLCFAWCLWSGPSFAYSVPSSLGTPHAPPLLFFLLHAPRAGRIAGWTLIDTDGLEVVCLCSSNLNFFTRSLRKPHCL